MSDPAYIAKSVVSAAITSAVASVKPLLLAAEAAAAAMNFEGGDVATLQDSLETLHRALASELANADALLGTGTMHTDGGGTDKGDGS